MQAVGVVAYNWLRDLGVLKRIHYGVDEKAPKVGGKGKGRRKGRQTKREEKTDAECSAAVCIPPNASSPVACTMTITHPKTARPVCASAVVPTFIGAFGAYPAVGGRHPSSQSHTYSCGCPFRFDCR